MIKSLRESKAKLSELVELASRGQEVLITVRGKVKARLVSAVETTDGRDNQDWAQELADLQQRHSTGRTKLPVEDILAEDREDRP